MTRMRAAPALLSGLLPALLCALGLALPESPALATPVPALDHIIVIVMENKSYDQVRTAPFTASLIAAGSSFSNSFGITHPSQPNYLALWAGSTMWGTSNNLP